MYQNSIHTVQSDVNDRLNIDFFSILKLPDQQFYISLGYNFFDIVNLKQYSFNQNNKIKAQCAFKQWGQGVLDNCLRSVSCEVY